MSDLDPRSFSARGKLKLDVLGFDTSGKGRWGGEGAQQEHGNTSTAAQ